MQTLERLKNKTILLVEDEKIIRENIASMLKFFFKEVYVWLYIKKFGYKRTSFYVKT